MDKSDVKGWGSTPRSPRNLRGLGPVGEGGTPGVAVECADIGWNTGGEGGPLGRDRR